MDVLNQTLSPPLRRGETAPVTISGAFASDPSGWAVRFTAAAWGNGRPNAQSRTMKRGQRGRGQPELEFDFHGVCSSQCAREPAMVLRARPAGEVHATVEAAGL